MKGEERYLLNLLEGTKTRFLIPVYQRNYDWKKEQCRQLFEDIETIVNEGADSHFFGSIVSKADGDVRIVIDGQQRITTSYLLLLALVNQIKAGTITTSDESLATMINEEYLIDRFHKDDRKLKLKLIKGDQAAFEAIYDGNPEKYVMDSNITQNYLYFCERIEKTDLDADQLHDGIEKLMIIDIKLNKEDDAQRIFESLNSTGLDLSEGDKIRNFILMGIAPDQQEEYYEKYWNAIEKNTYYDVSSFARDWLASMLRKTPAMAKVYPAFKDYVRRSGQATEELLEHLLSGSEYYRIITQASSGNPVIDIILRRLNLMGMSIVNPFLLNLFEFRSEGGISDQDTAEVLSAIESYLFRRWVVGAPSNALNKVFETLHSETMRGVVEGGDYADVLIHVLLCKEGSSRFPDNNEYLAGFADKDFYNIRNYKYYLYDRLENGDSVERVNVVKGIREGDYTIEHIMPQTLNGVWMEDLGEDCEAIHKVWLNKMANLTLTGYNQKYSNRRFTEKRDIENGFRDSGFRLNAFVKDQDTWGVTELSKRDEIMRRKFLELWPMPSSDFSWSGDSFDEYGLDEDADLTGRKIAGYSFLGTRYKAKNWADMIIGVLSDINDLDPVALQKYVPEGTEFPGRYFSSTPEEYCFQIAPGVFFNPGSSTQIKQAALRVIFGNIGLNENELSFELYKIKDADSKE